MSVFTVTINDPSPAFDKKAAEVGFIIRVLQEVEKELGRGQGTVTSGTVISTGASGTANTSLGSWIYTAAATHA